MYNAFSQSSKNISQFGKEKSLFKYCVSLAHFLAAKCFFSWCNLSKISKGSTNKPWDCCCQSNVIPFVVKVEQKQKTAASSPWDGENAYMLAAVEWKKIMAENGINWLSDKSTISYWNSIMWKQTETWSQWRDQTWNISPEYTKDVHCKWVSKPESACMGEEHSAHTDMD